VIYLRELLISDQWAQYTPILIFLLALVSGFLPVINTEILISLSVTLFPNLPLPMIIGPAVAAHVPSKVFLYRLGGLVQRKADHKSRFLQKSARLRRKLEEKGKWGVRMVMFSSGLLGFPPFTLTSFSAGYLRRPQLECMAIGLAGMTLRFIAICGSIRYWQNH
jgi:membrane protein YqaA with SNARE-associated domain